MAESLHSAARQWPRPSCPAATLDIAPESERATESKMRALGVAAMLFPMVAIVAFVARPQVSSALGAPSASEFRAAREPAAGASPPTIAGKILDAWGNPVKSAEVRAIASERPSHVLIARTNDEGAFKFATFPFEKVRIVAEDDGAGLVESEDLDVRAARNVVLVLGRAPDLTGFIRDVRGVGVAHATVKVAGANESLQRIVTADDDGRYLVHRVPGGAAQLTAWARGFDPSSVSVAKDDTDVIHRDLELTASRPIRGWVVDAKGLPVAHATVSACQGADVETALSDPSGEFDLPATSAGCMVTAQHPRFASARPTLADAVRPMTIRLGTGGAIEGVAVNQNGKSIGSFSVSIDSFSPADGESETSGRSGESRDELRGRFRFDDLPPGTYTLGATAEGFGTAQSSPIEVGRGKVVRGVRIVVGEAPSEAPETPSEEPSSPEPEEARSAEPETPPGIE